MFCSNCGAPLPPNGICMNCGVPAPNMMFDGNLQGQPVVPQQPYYNPNPMYVQYQGPQQGYGQPYIQQENVAIKGIKDPKLLAYIGMIIKDSCGSMMMVFAALLTTVAMIFSYIDVFYICGQSSYDEDVAVLSAVTILFAMAIPFTLFTIGMWLTVFQGFGTYRKCSYNDKACMYTSGFSTIQAGAIVALVPTACVGALFIFVAFMTMIAGVAVTFGTNNVHAEDVAIVSLAMIIILGIVTLLIVCYSSIISQMSKIKHAIRGRNYESISLLLPVFLFIFAVFQVICLIFMAIDGEIFRTIISGIYAIWYTFTGCMLLYTRSRVNSYIL